MWLGWSHQPLRSGLCPSCFTARGLVSWAAKNADGLSRFLKAAGEAKTILASSDAEWDRIRPLTQASDDAAFAAYRARYREGIPTRSTAEEETDARRLYKVLAELGGAELVGPASELDPGTYYKPAPGL